MHLRRFSTLPAISVLTLLYFLVGKLSLKLAFLHASASPVWPPAGIALAALIVLGYRVWPAIFVGAFLVNATTAGNIATSLCIATGNTLQAVFGGWFPITAKNYPISFVCGPLLIWAAFRFTQRETATAVFILSAIAMWGTLQGFGPFVMETENHSLLITQSSTAVLAITALALAAAMAERRRAEKAISQQKAAVEAANRTKDNFLAMLSHELRTPLTPVLAALDALEVDGARTPEAKNSLSMIRRNVELESQLIDDLLDLTRIAKDKLQLRFGPLDAHEVINNVVEICRPEAQARNLKLHLNLRGGAHHISGDAAKYQQIVWNLLKNAIKFN